MSKYSVPDKYDLLTCPFDPLHQVDAIRFQRHLLRCRKQNPHMQIRHCPFNHTHVVSPDQYQYHLNKCPDRVRIDQEISRDNDSRRMRGNLALPPPPDYHFDSSENWDEELSDAIPSSFINTQHAQRGPTSVVHQFPEQSGIQGMRPPPPEPRMPKAMPNIMRMTGMAGDTKQAMALAGIGRGAPTNASLSGAGAASRGPGASSSASVINGFTGQDIQNMSFGRGGWNAPSVASTNHISFAPGGLAGRAQMGGVAPPSGQLQAMPGVARGRGRGFGRGSTKVGHHLNGSVGTPSPPSSEASDTWSSRDAKSSQEAQSSREAAANMVFDPNVKIAFMTPNVNKQAEASGGQQKQEDLEEEVDAKYVRKLKKNMRDINRLEEKRSEGQALSQEEQRKVAMKKDIMEQLEALTLDDSE